MKSVLINQAFIFMTLIVGFTHTAFGETLHLYVGVRGKESNNGLSTNSAFATLQNAEYYLRSIREQLIRENKSVIVHILPGRYKLRGQKASVTTINQNGVKTHNITAGDETRWEFSLPSQDTIIEGAGKDQTIFDGANHAGPTRWLNFARPDSLPMNERRNIIVRKLSVHNYYSGVRIGGIARTSFAVEDNITIEQVNFRFIGSAYDGVSDLNIPTGDKVNLDPSRSVIYSNNSDANIIQGCLFNQVSNDINFTPDYINYGGMHAIYLDRSSHFLISGNSFMNIYAIGIIKTRDFSNYTNIRFNRFYDDTNIVRDQYCNHNDPVCASYGSQWSECPSYGARFEYNTSKYNAYNNRENKSIYQDAELVNLGYKTFAKSNNDIFYLDFFQANENYCARKREWFAIKSSTPRLMQMNNYVNKAM
jgi:hypothetical protein